MIIDAQLTFSDAQAVTATANSTNVIDTGPLFAGNTGRNLGAGVRHPYIFITVDIAMTDASSDSTLAVALVTDDNAALSSATTIATLTTFAALTAAGTTFFAPLPVSNSYERYIALTFTPANGNLSTGSFTAGITLDPQAWVPTASGFTVT